MVPPKIHLLELSSGQPCWRWSCNFPHLFALIHREMVSVMVWEQTFQNESLVLLLLLLLLQPVSTALYASFQTRSLVNNLGRSTSRRGPVVAFDIENISFYKLQVIGLQLPRLNFNPIQRSQGQFCKELIYFIYFGHFRPNFKLFWYISSPQLTFSTSWRGLILER